ncbi:MAG: arsenate reductase ArsC [Gammaproteobacteria bacterium]|nr:arsenate reductase ArsC [Gammaproteobacteria bacterium]MDH5651949.1 arsenate reductase ArsC [Gammaproteobacteria bacterium]
MKVLFLCTGNSCRSQMAEGWARAVGPKEHDYYSAGIEKHGMNENAIRVMREAGVDISGHYSKTLDELADQTFDVVVTVCGHANETCPVFPGKTRVVHVGFDDPPKLAQQETTEEGKLAHYRRVRDEIETFVRQLETRLAG